MGRTCREVEEWAENEIAEPLRRAVERRRRQCERENCNPWILCANIAICWATFAVLWLLWIAASVLILVVVTVCTVVNFVLDVIGFIIGLILSIPIVGGIIRTVLNWILEVFWRIIGLVDFVLSLLGARFRKKIYFGIVVPNTRGAFINQNDIQGNINMMVDIFDRECNIDAIFTGFCVTNIAPPFGTIEVRCDGIGFFQDWWLNGSWFELASNTCKFESNWRRVIGYGGEIIAFVVDNVGPDTGQNDIGCSMSGTHNYVVLQSNQVVATPVLLAHEIGHACLLGHNADPNNMMAAQATTSLAPTLTNWQVSVIRGSRHVVYI